MLCQLPPNHLDRQFVSDRANRHWVSDMTYERTAQGWLYLAVVLDLYSRAIVGWAMHHRMQQALVHAALEMGFARRQPKEQVLLHSDRGSPILRVRLPDLASATSNRA